MGHIYPERDSLATLRALAAERPEASRLHLARLLRGFSTQQLANLARLHFNTVYRLEHQGRRPSYATAARLASALDLPVSELFAEHEQLASAEVPA